MSDICPSATLATCAAAEKIFSKLKRNSSGEKKYKWEDNDFFTIYNPITIIFKIGGSNAMPTKITKKLLWLVLPIFIKFVSIP